MKKKMIVVIGGVTSGVGKGVIAASIAHLLVENGYHTTMIKFDGLLNLDFEQMNPYHEIQEIPWSDEEVTVLDDGSVVDSDIGVYERFTGIHMSFCNNIINGACWRELIELQEKKYWKTGEVIAIHPHLTNIYAAKIKLAIENYEYCVLEVGGTIGDYESEHFIRTLVNMCDDLDLFVVQLSFVPLMGKNENQVENFINQNAVLKPAKYSYNVALSLGLKPDAIILRSNEKLGDAIKKRVGGATGISFQKIFSDYDMKNIYQVPQLLIKQGFINLLNDYFEILIDKRRETYITKYAKSLNRLQYANNRIQIALIGNTESWNSYTTLQEALMAAAVYCNINVDFQWIKRAQDYINFEKEFADYDAYIVTEGNENEIEKRKIISWALKGEKPLLCISYAAGLMAELLGLKVNTLGDLIVGSLSTIIQDCKNVTFNNFHQRHRRKFLIPLDGNELEKVKVIGVGNEYHEVHIFESLSNRNCKGVVFHPEYNSRPNRPTQFLIELINKASEIKERK